MKTGLQGLCLLSIAVGIGGCYTFNKYTPLVETTPTSGAQYRCEIKRLDRSSGDLCTTVYDDTNRKKKPLRLNGKAQCMTVNSTGDVLAIGILVPTDHDGSPPVYVPDHDAIVFIDAENLREINRWPIKAPGVAFPAPGPYVDPIVRFDELAFSDDNNTVATYYWKPVDGGRQAMVTLWDVASGECLKELPLGPPDQCLQGVIYGTGASDLAFSPNGELIAVSGRWSIKDSNAIQPDPFIFVWRTSGESRYVLRPKGHWLISGLCFDQTSTRLAGLSDNTVLVWSVPEGKLLLSKRFKNPVSAIIRIIGSVLLARS